MLDTQIERDERGGKSDIRIRIRRLRAPSYEWPQWFLGCCITSHCDHAEDEDSDGEDDDGKDDEDGEDDSWKGIHPKYLRNEYL